MNKNLKVGVIGFGQMGQIHAGIYNKLPGVDLVAVCEFNDERRAEAEKEYGCQTYKNYKDLLENPEIDAVSIVLPDNMHREAVEIAVANKKHILLEKPLAKELADGEAMYEILKDYDKVFSLGFLLRFDPRFNMIKQRLDAGELGDIIHMYCRRNSPIVGPRRYIGASDLSMHVMIHDIDYVNWFMGCKPVKVFAKARSVLLKESGMEEVRANGILGEQDNTIDVLILGDSEAYSSISPLQIWQEKGYTSYLCATSNQTLDYTYQLLQRAFQGQSPKVVILETDAIYQTIQPQTAVMTWLKQRFSIFRYHNRWKSLTWRDLTGQASYTWTDETKGYHFSRAINPSTIEGHMEPTNRRAEISTLSRHYVEKIHQLCQSNGARFILLSTPSTVNWNRAKHNSVEELSRKLDCTYVDLNLETDRIPIDWNRDTRDKGDHLNYFGAVKVTKYMASYLEDTGLLTDHRNDPAFSSWDQALKKYETLISSV